MTIVEEDEMMLLTVPTDVNIIRETVDFFKELGFSEQYVKEIERDLMQQESKVLELLECQAVNAQN